MKLSIIERIYCIAILNNYKGTIDVMAKILEDAKKLALTDEEREEIEYKQEEREINGNKVPFASWNATKEKEKEIDLQRDVKEFIIKTIKDKEKEGAITFEDKPAISLMEKL